MKTETNLCMSCMNPIPEGAALTHSPGECPHCNWIDNGVYLASYLYPKTLLAGRYIVGKLISYNGEGALYAGYDTLTESKITIKEYMPDALCTRARDVLPLSVNPGELPLYKTYLSEFIELNRSLQSFGSSPRIQKITDVFSENNTAYAVHQYVSGISLAEYMLSTGGLTLEQVKELFPPVLTVLAKINTAGIIHRGISPKTIYIHFENDVPSAYITDFAITAARIFGSKINSEVFAGYAAPEQHNWIERHGDWTDVYGFSALLYNVLTGIVPQDAPSRLKEDKLIEPMLVNGLIPVSVSKAIMRGMELSADKRVKTIDELSRLMWGVTVSVSAVNDTQAFTSTSMLTNNSANSLNSANSRYNSPPESQGGYNPKEFVTDDDRFDDFEVRSRLNARKRQKEHKRKTAMIATLSVISAVVVLFLFGIIIAVANPDIFRSDPNPPPTGGGNEIIRYTPPPVPDGDPDTESIVIDLTQEGQVTKFVGEKFREGWQREARFDFLEFEFLAEYNNEQPKGIVFYQSIEQGEIVPFGTKITIKYSLGPEFVVMPNFAGMSVVQLTDALLELGVALTNIQVEEIQDPFFTQEGMVTTANIQPGGHIRVESYPGDAERQATVVIIYKAVPIPVQPYNPGRPGGGGNKPPR